MVEIAPFRGLRYAPSLSREPVFSPPYDVIDASLRNKLLEASPHNVVHVTFGPEPTPATWYDEAARRFQHWQAQGVLLRDAAPSFYAHEQAFVGPDGQTMVRRGFFARVRLVPWGQGIHPHEKTRSGPKADRLRLMRSLHAQESPVFGIYRDSEGSLDAFLGAPPDDAVTAVDDEGVRHTCWPLSSPALLTQMVAYLAERDIVIADGHHRYETALAYRDEVRARAGREAPSGAHDYVLMYLTPADGDGLVILPTHRVVTAPLPGGEIKLPAALEPDFCLEPIAEDTQLATALAAHHDGAIKLGLYLPPGAWLLTLRDRARAHAAAPPDQPRELAELDVAVLQNLILAPYLAITTDTLAHGDAVRYTTHADEARLAVREGGASAAFVLNPTSVDQVWRAAIAGVTMPQKSTYFYPKLLTGLVMNPLDD
jgi:uncharacterized protein (DUF1015 family)